MEDEFYRRFYRSWRELARQRGMLKVQRVMDVAYKTQILPRGGFAFWMYRR